MLITGLPTCDSITPHGRTCDESVTWAKPKTEDSRGKKDSALKRRKVKIPGGGQVG